MQHKIQIQNHFNIQINPNAINLKKLIDKGILSNVLENDTIRNFFDTDLYLENPYRLFDGDSTVYKRGLSDNKIKKKGEPRPPKGAFTGRQVTSLDGILSQKIRLPTEVEWEYAAKATSENREYNNIRGRKKYAWSAKYTRDNSERYKGDQLANFKQGDGDYGGIAGWSDDGADITAEIKSYQPNDFGLYDMSGNVAEWVADVYRPIVDDGFNDFNYYRGNVYTKNAIDENGKVKIVTADSIVYDTLSTGKVIARNLPGEILQVPVDENETYLRTQFSTSDNRDYRDGDKASTRFYQSFGEQEDEVVIDPNKRMYNSPNHKVGTLDESEGGGVDREFDKSSSRTSMINNEVRVYKGGSWKDRDYWLDPAQRRYFPQDMATDYIGFRCAMSRVGSKSTKPKRARH